MSRDNQTINSLNNFDVPVKKRKRHKDYIEKYNLKESKTNKLSAWITNPTVQPDDKTEMGVPIPDVLNTEFSKEYQEENKL
ncbi:MAG: hypothetical protein ACI4RR_02765 [Eubacterium sp.]